MTASGGAISDGGFAPGDATSGGSPVYPNIVIAGEAGLNLVSSNVKLNSDSGGGSISGSGGIAKFGIRDGDFRAARIHTARAAPIINGGVLQFSSDSSLGTGDKVTLNGGTLASGQTAIVTMTRTIATGSTGGTIQLNNGSPVSGNNKIVLSATGEITGSGSITVSNNGLLSISAANSGYRAAIGHSMAAWWNSRTISPRVPASITVNSGSGIVNPGQQDHQCADIEWRLLKIGWDFFSNSGDYQGPVTLLSGGECTVSLVNFYGTGAMNGTISGNISGTGGLSTSATGPGATSIGGALTLSGSNSYTGGTIIGLGTSRLQRPAVTRSAAPATRCPFPAL